MFSAHSERRHRQSLSQRVGGKRPPISARRLAVESLELRQMLSATSMTFQVVDDGSTNVSHIYGAGGAPQGSSTLVAANAAPRGTASTVAADKTWVVDANRNVYVYNASGGLLGSWSAGSLASNATPEGIATDGNDVWIVDGRSDKVFRYTGAAGRLAGSQSAASSFILNSGNANPKDVVTDGASLWIVDDAAKTDKVFKYSLTGSYLGSWTIDSSSKTPTGIAIDPANVGDIWIADNGADRVYKYVSAASRNSGSQSASSSFALSTGNGNAQGLVVPGRPWSETPYEVQWVRQIGGAADELGLGVGADGNGNVYLSGGTDASSPGADSPYLASYGPDGSSNWVRQQQAVPGTDSAGVRVAADAAGNVFQVENGAAHPSVNSYDSAGTLRWTASLPAGEGAYGLAVDNVGNAYTSTSGPGSVVIRQFDGQTGAVLWLQTLDVGPGWYASGIDVDALGQVYVAGYTSGAVIGPNVGGVDGFVAKLSNTGALAWARQFGSAGTDFAWDVTADALGNVYTIGQTTGSLGGPNAGENDVFVTKHDAAGNLQWIRQRGTTGDESYNGVWADPSGNVYATGWTRAALGGAYLGDAADAQLAKYNTSGDLLWAKQLGTTGRDSTNDIVGDDLGNIYLAGNTRGSWTASNAGGADFVLIKLSQPASSAVTMEAIVSGFDSGAVSESRLVSDLAFAAIAEESKHSMKIRTRREVGSELNDAVRTASRPAGFAVGSPDSQPAITKSLASVRHANLDDAQKLSTLDTAMTEFSLSTIFRH